MKKIIISLLFVYSTIISAQTMSNEDKSCVENLENEIVKIVNSNAEDEQEAIEILKAKVKTDSQETCESDFQEEIKRLVFGNKKALTSEVIEKHAKEVKKNSSTANLNSQDCIENFEAEVIKIINSNPNNIDKIKTKKIMHEIMHEKVKASCESVFEEETKKIVHSKSTK